MMKVAVVGAAGRMGSSVCEAVLAAGMDLVARLDAGDPITEQSLAGADVVVEFSVPDATDANVHAILDAGSHAVVGTTGWTAERLDAVREHAQRVGKNALIAPNFALSAVLAMAFAEKAAAMFESVEVIELHHPDKVDAPSGTATTSAQRIGAARKAAGMVSPDNTQSDPLGTRGGQIEGVRVHAVRLRGLYAHEEILLGNPGEQLTIRQDSFGRESFMPGILLAVREVANRPGLTYGLEPLLNL
ncbi:4-hydroxy-tetrahydrodipicolinate reductase [Trueperella pecoris]|uniref:4-hydroxy-tetrahydrodipicolinate reductase n=1 Tax=Trueperella pecoris TaxID=2733571 RepID=A0A7M1QWM0_9ACTO|nr:4-hydroxy-tetrahydrodipicolinate reductase [Trueperella pecoris]QOQ39040.1 4-hydroxy-tetrahydrodipicolinate reductase [Trueperella pecoris]QOR46328.1 4-hydroxy-tetrahydrodipicolinate reductase [Trueperella pecoris]